MGMAAILVMWPGPFEQLFVPPPQGGSTWNLASIGPVISERKMFENVDVRRTIDNWGLPILWAHQWAFSSGERKNLFKSDFIHIFFMF